MDQARPLVRDARRGATAFLGLGVSTLTPQSVSSRIRAAIELGVLSDGDALPKEADLATQMGVTVHTLREALAQLRAEGLIVTRAGRGGGSFVHRTPEDTGSAALAQLKAMSSVTLRDLGDWRTMIAAESAELASSRASKANIARLRAFADQVRSSDRTVARRASARFRVELAASAQSLRMSGADAELYEEFGALLAIPLEEQRFRRESAAALDEIVDAIEKLDGPAARAAAVTESRHTVDVLLRIRLRLIGSHGRGTRKSTDQLTALATTAWDLVSGVIDDVTDLAAETEQPLRILRDEDAPYDEDLDDLTHAATKVLSASGRHVQGMGVMFDPGAIPHHRFGGAWVVRRNGEVVRNPHVADPKREDFYDYSMAEWMTEPRASGVPAVVGPYVDYGGVDDYIFTVAVPIRIDDVFLGVAAADIRLSDYEVAIAPALGAVDRACCLVNAEDRIIVSNSVRFAPGSLLPSARGHRRRPCGTSGWSIVHVVR